MAAKSSQTVSGPVLSWADRCRVRLRNVPCLHPLAIARETAIRAAVVAGSGRIDHVDGTIVFIVTLNAASLALEMDRQLEDGMGADADSLCRQTMLRRVVTVIRSPTCEIQHPLPSFAAEVAVHLFARARELFSLRVPAFTPLQLYDLLGDEFGVPPLPEQFEAHHSSVRRY